MKINKNILGFDYIHHKRENLSYALNFSLQNSNPNLRLGFIYKVDPLFTVKSNCLITGDENMRVGLALKQSISRNIKLHLSADLNANKILKGKNEEYNHLFGVKLTFFD